ncbi:hypothetical protein GCM10027413_07970 [Conyzicola nivalis]|uniref:Uncharacterized protein n=1 Tax=Conyzicola nivalis TaxID=1477021 RepID=A0A916SMW3_9MICO|nr:hypothetical protein [Conyzicola nivalis]GGB04217.1 hypothetical protein GCM10010979_18660 [Conyzicola nivalis]
MPTPEETADARQQRAEELLKAVAGGANLGEETLKMSNEFTDEWTARFTARLKRIFRR